jgi:integrase
MVSKTFGMKERQICVAEAINAYLEHAERYYNGGSEYKGVYDACEPLARQFASLPIRDFGITQFKVIREHWIKRGCSRQYVNKQMKRLLRVAKWLVAEQIADPMLHHSLKCVDNLKQGRCDVPEAEPITPVSDADVDAAVQFMPPVIADMVRLQRLIGCRPGELCQIKPAMVDTSGDVWTITIVDHKNAWRGKDRIIAVGPKAQAILKPYLDRGLSAYCFSPKEAMQQRDEARHKARKTSMSCGNKPGTNKRARPRKDSDCYTTGTYGNAIRYACKRAKIEPWSPNQLRHAAATHLRKLEGIEAASVILGHSQISTTEIYAEKNFQAAVVVARKHG